MDYIIFGMGTGATLVLVGWLLRELGPRVRDRAPADDEVLSGGELVVRMAWARFCGTCGMALLLCGILILFLTGIMMAIAPEDGLASIMVLATFGVCVALMLVWTSLYLRQFGTIGVIRPKPEPVAPAAEPGVAQIAAADPGQVATEAPAAQSFEEAAAARGGFARFGARLRRQPSGPSEPEARPATGEHETVGTSDAAATAATDAVIAELSGQPEAEEDKRLSLDDPLVISVQTPAQARAAMEHAALAEGSPEAAGGDIPGSTATPHDSLADNNHASEGDDWSAAEAAVDSLRQRRIQRLTQGDDTD